MEAATRGDGEASRRERLDPDERRRRLLDAANEAFSTRPFEAVKISEIARDAGASKALVFSYFGSKRELYLECIRGDLAAMAEAADPDPSLPPRDRFVEGLTGLLDLIEARPFALPGRVPGALGDDPEAQRLVDEINAGVRGRIIGRMGAPQDHPELRFAVESWIAFVHTSTRSWLAERAVPRERLVELQIAAFRSLAAEALAIPAVPSGPGDEPPLLP